MLMFVVCSLIIKAQTDIILPAMGCYTKATHIYLLFTYFTSQIQTNLNQDSNIVT